MKRFKFCGLPLCLAVVLGGATAFSAKGRITNTLTLDDAIQCALTNNPEIRVLSAEIAIARGEATTAQTWQNPELSVAPGFKQFRNSSDKQFHGDFGLEQTFEWPGKRTLRRAVAEKNVTVHRLALDGFRSQITIQVRRAYFALLSSGETVALNEQRLSLAKSFVEAARKRVENGFAPEFETTKAEVEVVAAQKTLREAQARHGTALVELNALMGLPPDNPLTITGKFRDASEVPKRSGLLAVALQLNPALKVQEAEAERTGLSLQSIRKSRLPDFTLGPSLEYTRDEQILGFGISLPLPLWNNKKGEIAAATAEQERALAGLEKLRREITRDVTKAIQNFAAARETLAFFTPELRTKLKKAMDAASDGYAEGHTPLLLYLESQRTYFDTQADYLETLRELVAARAELESSVGLPLDQLNPSPTSDK